MESIFDNLLSILTLYKELVVTFLVIAASVITVVIWWDKFNYILMNIRYGMPVFGIIARTSKKSKGTTNGDWFYSEKKLCDDFYSYYGKNDYS